MIMAKNKDLDVSMFNLNPSYESQEIYWTSVSLFLLFFFQIKNK